MTAPPLVASSRPVTAVPALELASLLLDNGLVAYIQHQRWYGHKAERLTGLAAVDGAMLPLGDDERNRLLLLIVEARFASAAPARYFVPLILSRAATVSQVVARVAGPDGDWLVGDAVHEPAFHAWIVRSLSRSGASAAARFSWSANPAFAAVAPAAATGVARVSSAQQSNTSIVFESSLIVKVFRGLSDGINPEVELGELLSRRTNFRETPALYGAWQHQSVDGQIRSLAVAQSYIANTGDGWSYVIERLTSGDFDLDPPRELGEITARMHLALASANDDEHLGPEPITPEDAERWRAATARALGSTRDALSAHRDQQPAEIAELIGAFLDLTARLSDTAAGFERLIGRHKTRVHGDYHLGQTLRTVAGGFVVLDFEGEPRRSIAERREKLSPLKDVAGMLRSFGYARGVVERDNRDDQTRLNLATWERSARQAFVTAYVATARGGGARFLPESDDDVRQAIAAWELDKALYEVAYELNNRPDWLEIPLRATVKLA